MTRPKLFLAPVDTLRGNRAHEWRGTSGRLGELSKPDERSSADSGAFWKWLTGLTREAARGQAFRPGGRVGW